MHLGVYRIVGPLGAGGMGEVYRAHDPRLGRDVALKVLPAAMRDDPLLLERFTREARAIAALNHPHIVTIYSTEEADGVRFLTMELVEGEPLDALIPREGLPLARFLEIAVPLADALTAAHQKQITHRDLKPANVIVATDGRVKVLDFGLARVGPALATDPASDATRAFLTSEGTIVGTMPYMSPEQIEGKALDHRTDLFSLGVMFHEMLTGSRPFTGESSPQLMSSILRDTPGCASEVRADVPDSLSRLVQRCLEKRPDDRVQTARDIYNELKHVQKQLESSALRRMATSDAGASVVASPFTPASSSTWIAVMPFNAAGSDEESRTLADTLTEDVTAGFARFPYLAVVAAHTARKYRDTTADARSLGSAVGARYLVDGTVRRMANAIRVVVRLVDSESGAQLWSGTYPCDLSSTDLVALEDDLTDRIVGTVADVHGVLMRSMSQGVTTVPMTMLDRHGLRLRYWAYHRQHAPGEHGALREVFERMTAEQPAFAPGWAALAHLYWHEHGFNFNPRPDSLGRARHAVSRALALDALNQHAWEGLATIQFFERDREGFAHAAERALSLNPRNANATALAGILFVHAGELDRGVGMADRAMTLNPDHPGWYYMARANRDYVIGDNEGALRAAKRINMPDHVWGHFLVALAAAELGRSADATSALETVIRIAPGFADEATVAALSDRWKWNTAHAYRMLTGYRKAVALSRAPGAAVTPVVDSGSQVKPSSGAGAAAAASSLSVAVRPFASRGGERAADLAEGLTDDVTTSLSRFSYLRVVPRPAAEHEAATARYFVEGHVRRAGSSLRVSARLIERESGAQLWADNYDRSADSDIFQLQDDVSSRIVATVADANGVMLRSMAATLRQLPIAQHTIDDLVVRFHGFLEHFDPAEHAQIRDQLVAALRLHPGHADGWACLSALVEHEFSHGLNPLPDSLARARAAAERAVAADPRCQEGWRGMASAAFFARDAAGVSIAAERAIAINPLNTGTVAVCGLFLAYSGSWERGLAVTRQAMEPNPHYPGWLHFPLFSYYYNRADYAEALAHAKRINMPLFPKLHLSLAAAAGQLGRVDEARAALDALARLDPASRDDDYPRRIFASWLWSDEDLDRIVDGVDKARRISGSGVTAPHRSAAPDLGAHLSARADSRAVGIDPFAITVVPFAAPAAGAAADLADGLAQGITVGLSRFSYLRARRRTVAQEHVAAGYVVHGSVRQADAIVRVVVELVDATTGDSVWADTYDRPHGGSIFALQDELTEKIVATIADANGALVRTMSAAIRRKPAGTLTPYEAVIRGLVYLTLLTPEEHAEVKRDLEQAVAQVPTYADAWAALAFVYSEEHAQGFNRQSDAVERARAAVKRALDLDSENLLAYYALVRIAFFSRDVSAFHAAAERAMALNPLATHVLAFVGTATAYLGDWEKGLAIVDRAMALNPHHPGIYRMPSVIDRYRRGDYAGALTILDRVNTPGYPHALLARAAVYAQLGRLDEARALWQQGHRQVPGFLADLDQEMRKWFEPELVAQIKEAIAKAAGRT